jgi:hypothetical protein
MQFKTTIIIKESIQVKDEAMVKERYNNPAFMEEMKKGLSEGINREFYDLRAENMEVHFDLQEDEDNG